jgi:hypothetical protein
MTISCGRHRAALESDDGAFHSVGQSDNMGRRRGTLLGVGDLSGYNAEQACFECGIIISVKLGFGIIGVMRRVLELLEKKD